LNAEPIIGTLKERSLHAVLKNHYQPDKSRQECRVGKYIADVVLEDGSLLEIQTRQFYRMKEKLAFFLKEHEVTVVYPVSRKKWLSWIEPETGTVTSRRKSPKEGKRYEIFRELDGIRPLLHHPGLHIRVMLADVEEFRLLDGWGNGGKRGSHRAERVPVALGEEYRLDSAADYASFVPEMLPEAFGSAAFGKAAGLPPEAARGALRVLCEMNAVEKCGKKGNAILYRRTVSH